MNKILRIVIVSLFLIFSFTHLNAQQHSPFYDEIEHFKKSDSVHFPPSNAILFVGSSSFQKWHDVQSYFPGYTIINRGFGGSQLTDAIYYANDIILPYHPRQVVIYSGENDLASSDTVSSKTVFTRFIALFNIIRTAMPMEPIIYISIKPSPSRKSLMPKMEEANKLIKDFLQTQKRANFIDVFHLMLDKEGNPLHNIYVEDNLHMNTTGYHIWQRAIKPYLIKEKRL